MGRCAEYADIFIPSLIKYLLSTSYVLGTVLGAGGVAGNQTSIVSALIVITLCVCVCMCVKDNKQIKTNIRWRESFLR